jgi:hypothetical protein
VPARARRVSLMLTSIILRACNAIAADQVVGVISPSNGFKTSAYVRNMMPAPNVVILNPAKEIPHTFVIYNLNDLIHRPDIPPFFHFFQRPYRWINDGAKLTSFKVFIASLLGSLLWSNTQQVRTYDQPVCWRTP